jgi:hypothetical protein
MDSSSVAAREDEDEACRIVDGVPCDDDPGAELTSGSERMDGCLPSRYERESDRFLHLPFDGCHSTY